MKKRFTLAAIPLLCIVILQTPACKKDPVSESAPLFKEEFKDVPGLQTAGWVLTSFYFLNSGPTWAQGREGVDKFGIPYGFPAYSHQGNKGEYAYIGFSGYPGADSLSAWMISPVITLKDGDKMSFYTRSEASGATDRLQVRLNTQDLSADVGTTNTSVGKFTILLHAVNPDAAAGGYPLSWSKREMVIGGLGGQKQVRLAFRYNPNTSASKGIGVDVLEINRP